MRLRLLVRNPTATTWLRLHAHPIRWMNVYRTPASLRSLAGIVSSALLFAVYARGGQAWWLGLITLLPWLLVLDATRSLRAALASAVAMSVAFEFAVFAWFGNAIDAYTGIGIWPATLLLGACAPILQPQFLAFALVQHVVGLRHGQLLRALAGASAWVGCEWLIPKLFGDTLGHGLYPSVTLRQVADLGGAAGISFALILIGEALAAAVRGRRNGMRAIIMPLAAALALLASMGGYGLYRLAALQAEFAQSEAPTIRIALVQAAIVDYERLRRDLGTHAAVRRVLDTHFALSQAAIDEHGADALVWPETVYPTTFGKPRSEDAAAFDREILDLVAASGVPLVLGTYDRDDEGEYNAAAFVDPRAGLVGFYRKTHPFPLTEYVPDWLDGERLRSALPWAGTWQPGTGARVFPLRTNDGRELYVQALICLDDVRTALAIDGARLGAHALIGLSNDAWFSAQPIGAQLHLTVAAFRSIETRLPQWRATTNGLSALIDPSGEVLASTSMGDRAVLAGDLPLRAPPLTLMVHWGDWVGRAALAFLLLIALYSGWQALARRAARRNAESQAKANRDEAFVAEVVVLSKPWRVITAALRLGMVAGLCVMALRVVIADALQINPLEQIQYFAWTVVVPFVAAWIIRMACSAQAQIDGAMLVLQGRTQRIEIPLSQLRAMHSWVVPLPDLGVDLELASGRRWQCGLLIDDPRALARALTAAGAELRDESAFEGRIAVYAASRASAAAPWLDHAAVKFLVAPLLVALPAFRLHQHIAFGGTFGEYYTYGAQAWLLGLLIWWASWSIGLVLLAAALRVAVEAISAWALLRNATGAADFRPGLMCLSRSIFYLGIPAWLLLRMVSD